MTVLDDNRTESWLRVDGLAKRYGDGPWAVVDSTFSLREGEFFGLLGPSGCGKSTTLAMLGGFVEPSKGSFILGDRDMLALPPHRRGIGMVFQDYALFPHLSAFDNVAYGLRVRRVDRAVVKKKVEAMLALVGLGAKSGSRPDQLSGGEQQRVALARALAIDPGLVLLDEPLSNLDAKLRVQMRHEIKAILREAGATAIFVTHDQAEALSMCDRLGVMMAGHIQQIAAPFDVYMSPVNRTIAEFVGEATFVPVVSGSGSRVSIKLGSSEVEVAVRATTTPSECGADEASVVMIRPEMVTVADAHTAGLRATVEGLDFQGTTVQYRLNVGGDRILALELATTKLYAVGSTVSVTLAASLPLLRSARS